MSFVHFKKFESSFHYLFVVAYYILWISTSIVYIKVLFPLHQWSLDFVVSVCLTAALTKSQLRDKNQPT